MNWERTISKNKIGRDTVVVKKMKSFRGIRQFVLIFCFTLMSICSGNPSRPPQIGKKMLENESLESRNKLRVIGINSPKLFSISNDEIIEEYIEGGNLYSLFTTENADDLAFQAGRITGILHLNKYVFIDNKCQNFLVTNDREIIRIDLGLIQKTESLFAKSMDIASFLASILDLEPKKYIELEKEFLFGYLKATHKNTPYLAIILRNILALGLVYNHDNMIKNMLNKERP